MITDDPIGFSTLQSIQAADRFNHWMYSAIRKFLKGSVLELGSGIGNISRFLLLENYDLTLSEVNEQYLSLLKSQFGHLPNAKGFLHIDLERPDFETAYAGLNNHYDSVFLLNVLEHIEGDKQAIENCRFLLKKEGNLIVLVPAYPFLFSGLDKQLGHFRRYTAETIRSLFEPRHFRIKKCFYFNAFGILAWMWNKVTGNQGITPRRMALYNRLVPLAKLFDVLTFHRAGLSVIIVAQKN